MPLERFHHKLGIPIKYFPKRGSYQNLEKLQVLLLTHRQGPARPNPKTYTSEKERVNDKQLVQHIVNTHQAADGISCNDIPKYLRPNDPFRKLLKLDSFIGPGLTQEEFEGLLTSCQHCQLIMTKRRADSHECIGTVVRRKVVIDLTGD